MTTSGLTRWLYGASDSVSPDVLSVLVVRLALGSLPPLSLQLFSTMGTPGQSHRMDRHEVKVR